MSTTSPFTDAQLDAGIAAWFGVTKVSPERAILRERMQAAVVATRAPIALPPMNDALALILGRPNFRCVHIADVLRKGGQQIEHKAEAEQAATIHFLLNQYLLHGDAWAERANDALRAIVQLLPQGAPA